MATQGPAKDANLRLIFVDAEEVAEFECEVGEAPGAVRRAMRDEQPILRDEHRASRNGGTNMMNHDTGTL